MERHIEEMISKGLIRPIKMRGTAWAVFRMIQVLAEYHLYTHDLKDWDKPAPEIKSHITAKFYPIITAVN